MLPARYLEPIILVFYCLRLDNWRAVDYAVNLKMFMVLLVDKEQFYVWFLVPRSVLSDLRGTRKENRKETR